MPYYRAPSKYCSPEPYVNSQNCNDHFSLQYKPFDDATRCSLFKHSCKPPICERSFVKRKIDFKFSLLLRRSKKSNMFGLGSDAEIVESITIENTGTANLYINSFHSNIIECESYRRSVTHSRGLGPSKLTFF